ncbi:hypothetical protein Esti_004352 [Eimeria stiedai]
MKLQLSCFALSLLVLGPLGSQISAAEEAGVLTAEDLVDVGEDITEPLAAMSHQVPPDVYTIQPRTYEVPGVAGLKRMLLGMVLLAALVAHLYFQLYPELMPPHRKAMHKALNLKEKLANVEQTSKLDYVAERYVKYAGEHPEIVIAEGAALFFGLIFFLSGIGALGRKRRMQAPALPVIVARP